LRECRERAEQTTVTLRLPRFKVERSFDLAATLKKAGVVSAFGPDADLSPITGGEEPLNVDQAKQAAFISVNEKGTEAGAATMQAMMMGAAIPNVEFYADRPFVYFIRDNATGAVLFAGRLVAPEPDGKTTDAEYWEQEDQEEKERKAKERRERLF
jgi:serpin B